MYPKFHFDIEQGSEEWHLIRKGKMTASHACEIGNNGKGLDTYITTLMAEKYSSGERPSFSNSDIERGHELEPQARDIYAFNKGVDVKECGFIEYNEYVGASPDGLVLEIEGQSGLIEIKSPSDVVYFKHLLNGASEIDSKYIWQMQMNLLISGYAWCDYVAYSPNFEPSIFVHRIYPDKEMFKKLMLGFEVGEAKIKAIDNKLSK